MSRHKSELISGLLDGQLGSVQRWRVLRHLRACPACATEYRQVRHARRLLRNNPPTAQMSDSPEFFWSKVKQEIANRGEQSIEVPMPSLSPRDWLGQHQLALASVAATFVAALGVLWFTNAQLNQPGYVGPVVYRKAHVRVEKVATAIPNTVATVLDADKAGVTVIWVSGLPWTADMDEMKARYDNLDI